MPILLIQEEEPRLLREDRGFLNITNWLQPVFNQTIDPSNLFNQAISSNGPQPVTCFGWASDNFCHFNPSSRWRSLQPLRSTTNVSLNAALLTMPSWERSLTS